MSARHTPDDWSGAAVWADTYRTLGLAVVPATVSPDGKRKQPLGAWAEFQEGGTPQAVHDRWYGKGGTAASTMGFITGRASLGEGRALLGIDIDVKDGKGGPATWRGWLAAYNNDMDLETWTARTGSGGLHYYFSYPAHLELRNTQETVDGIDVRAQGGFIMAPPSQHYLPGKLYTWMDGRAPWECEILPAPDWLIDLVLTMGDVSQARAKPSEKTEEPADMYDPFGYRINGRDKYMADMVFAAMLDARRLGPIRPPDIEALLERTYKVYAGKVRSRLPKDGRSEDERLEAEGRGLSAMRSKMQRHWKQWDTVLAQEARRPSKAAVERQLANAKVGDIDAAVIVRQIAAWWAEDGHPDAAWLAEEVATLPGADRQKEAPQGAGQPKKFHGLMFNDIVPNLDEEYLIEDIMPKQGVMFEYGDPGGGKTFLLVDGLLHVAAGRQWAGRDVAQGGIVYFAAEGGNGFRKRIAAARQYHEFPPDTPFMLISDAPNMGAKDGDADIVIHDIRVAMPLLSSVSAVVFDTLNKITMGADENDATAMGILIGNAEKIARALNCLVIIVHHNGKSETARGLRGSQALEGGSDCTWKVTNDNGSHRVVVERMKDGPSGMEWGFDLVPVTVGTSSKGKDVVSCAVDVTGEPVPVKVRRKRVSGKALIALQALDEAISQDGRKFNTPYLPSCLVVELERWRTMCDRHSLTDSANPETRGRVFRRVKDDLHSGGHIRIFDAFVWRTET